MTDVAAIAVALGIFAPCMVALAWLRSSYRNRCTQLSWGTAVVLLVLLVLVGLPNLTARALVDCPHRVCPVGVTP